MFTSKPLCLVWCIQSILARYLTPTLINLTENLLWILTFVSLSNLKYFVKWQHVKIAWCQWCIQSILTRYLTTKTSIWHKIWLESWFRLMTTHSKQTWFKAHTYIKKFHLPFDFLTLTSKIRQFSGRFDMWLIQREWLELDCFVKCHHITIFKF